MGRGEVFPVSCSRAQRFPVLWRSGLIALIVAIATVRAATASAIGERHDAFTGPGAEYYGYFPSDITIARGDTILYTNYDLARHDFVQDVETDGFGGKPTVPWCEEEEGHETGEHHHGCPVFWSKQIGNQKETLVRGLNRVKPGTTYTFFCTLHHAMKGTLTVTR